MQLNFVCPYWGQEGTSASHFLRKVIQDGYDGIEINMPDAPEFAEQLQLGLEQIRKIKPDFIFIAQQVLSSKTESVTEYISRMKSRLDYLVSLKPDFINSHTGKDYFSFDDNCRVIEAAENISHHSGVNILHETHRGRFTFHSAFLLPYVDRFPELKFTADFSHWCTVSESLLSDQHDIIEELIPYMYHLHARIGYEQSPQVNNPFAPEWKPTLDTFKEWWRKIIDTRRNR